MPVGATRVPLTRDRVLSAAVTIADEQGLDAVTLRRLADALQVHPTSIYNHLPHKDAILEGIAEQLVAEASLPTDVRSWQEWVRSFAAAIRLLAQRHPGAFRVFTRRQAQGVGADQHLEAALAAFAAAGFSTREGSEAVAGIALAIMGLALNEPPGQGAAPTPGLAHLEPDRFPHIAAAATAAPATSDGMWEVVVESLIRGLQAAHRKPRATKA